MARFKVVRDRAYWVREVMHIDAASEEEAEDKFFDGFFPELEVLEPFGFGIGTHKTPVEVTQLPPNAASD